jgi:hypothetical protein
MRTAGPERYACTCGRSMFMCIAIAQEPRESIIGVWAQEGGAGRCGPNNS